jgi:hypothetical protein
MAVGVVVIAAGTPQHLDDVLCPVCWRSGVWAAELFQFSPDGLDLVGIWTGCVDCHEPGKVERL